MKRGESDVLRKVERKRRHVTGREHPVPYGEEGYPWTVPPMACAACSTREAKPYRTLRTDSAQTLVLHYDCAALWVAKLRMDEASA